MIPLNLLIIGFRFIDIGITLLNLFDFVALKHVLNCIDKIDKHIPHQVYVTGRGFPDVAGHSGQTWRQRKRSTDREWTMSKKPCIPLLATGLVSLQTRALSD